MPDNGPGDNTPVIRREDEPLFTAAEVQAAVTAVILYERARCSRTLSEFNAAIDAAMRANRRDLSKRTHMTIDEIIRSAR